MTRPVSATGCSICQRPQAQAPPTRSGHRGECRAPCRHARRHGRVRQQGRDRADEEGDAVDGRDRGDLGERQRRVLRIAEQRPGEREEGVGARVLEGRPEERGKEEPGGPEGDDEARGRPPEEGVEDGEGEAEGHHHEDPDRQGQAAVLDDDERRPVEQADRGDGPGDVARAAPRASPTSRRAPRAGARAPPRRPPRARTSGTRGRGGGPRARRDPPGVRCSARRSAAVDLFRVEGRAHEDARVHGREPDRSGPRPRRRERPPASRSGRPARGRASGAGTGRSSRCRPPRRAGPRARGRSPRPSPRDPP